MGPAETTVTPLDENTVTSGDGKRHTNDTTAQLNNPEWSVSVPCGLKHGEFLLLRINSKLNRVVSICSVLFPYFLLSSVVWPYYILNYRQIHKYSVYKCFTVDRNVLFRTKVLISTPNLLAVL